MNNLCYNGHNMTQLAQTKDVGCRAICNVICGRGGVGAVLGRCAARCVLSGPGMGWCTAFCGILAGVGCLYGCDNICKLMD